MVLGKVVGHVVATSKHEALHGSKMLIVSPLSPDGEVSGPNLMAVDAAGAGVGERVLVVVEGRSACQAVRKTRVPIDAAIIGIVDRIDIA